MTVMYSGRKRSMLNRNLITKSRYAFLMLFQCSVCVACREGVVDITTVAANSDVVAAEHVQDFLTQLVTLKTSDSRVVIDDISSPWRDLKAVDLGTSNVTFQVEGDDHGYECAIEPLHIYTSNKAVIVPSGNICDNPIIEIDIEWPEYKSPPLHLKTLGFRWGLHNLPPTQDFPFPIDVLSYAIPETDNIVMSFECTRGSQQVLTKFHSSAVDIEASEDAPNINFINHDPNDPVLYRFASTWTLTEIPDGWLRKPSFYEHIDHLFFSEFEKIIGFDLLVEDTKAQVLNIDTQVDTGVLNEFIHLCRHESSSPQTQ